jgi:hypothetical protein
MGLPRCSRGVCGLPRGRRQGRRGRPALDDVATRYSAEALDAWLKDPASVKPGTAMPNLRLATRASGADRWLMTLAESGGNDAKYQSQRIAWLFFATCMLLLACRSSTASSWASPTWATTACTSGSRSTPRARPTPTCWWCGCSPASWARPTTSSPRSRPRAGAEAGAGAVGLAGGRGRRRGHRLPLQLVGGPQVPGDPAPARLPRRRQRAAFIAEHRHDGLERANGSPPPGRAARRASPRRRCCTCRA